MAAANLRSYTTDKDKPGLIYNDYSYREVLNVQKEQASTEVQIQKMAAGMNVGRHNAKYARITKNIWTLRRRYANHQLVSRMRTCMGRQWT
jgi:hypothetical protein